MSTGQKAALPRKAAKCSAASARLPALFLCAFPPMWPAACAASNQAPNQASKLNSEGHVKPGAVAELALQLRVAVL